MKWEQRLIAEAKIAFERGEEVTFSVGKREDKRFWRIYRKRKIDSGEEDYYEED